MKIVIGAAACVLVLLLSGCSTAAGEGDVVETATTAPPTQSAPSTPPPQTQSPSYAPAPFTVTESAFTTSDSYGGGRYIHWVAVLDNPNVGHYGTFPKITVTARDASGTVLATTQQVLSALPPGSRIAFATLMESPAEPASVEVVPADVSWYPTDAATQDFPPFRSDGVQISGTRFSRDVVGELVNPYVGAVDSLQVTTLFRDGAGTLTGGATGYVSGLPGAGRLPFSVSVLQELDQQPASIEVVSVPWGGQAEAWYALAQGGVAPGQV